MLLSKPPLSVSVFSSAEDMAAGMQFLEAKYRDVFGVMPSRPDCLIGARVGSEIVGTIGVNFGRAEGMRLLDLYAFDKSSSPLPVQPSRTVEIGRWVCGAEGVSAALALGAVRRSLAQRMLYGWCEHALPLQRVCRRFGIRFYPVEATLKRESIETEYKSYYDKNDARLYMFELDQAQAGLERYLSRH